jgi:sporulation protein YlmC with PRC-barrel domain
MKTRTLLFAAAVAVLPISLPAQDPRPSDAAIAELYRHGYRASDILGRAVHDGKGQSLGRIGDLVLDTRTGEILYAVVSTGGVLGIGDTTRAVPLRALRIPEDTKAIVQLDVDSSRWAAAPRFNAEEVALLVRDDRARELHEYYGQSWQPRDTDSSRDRRGVTLATWLRGKAVRAGERGVGQIEDLIVSLGDARAAVLFDPVDDFSGNAEKYVVPFTRFTIGELNPETVATALTSDEFRDSPALSDRSWARADAQQIYRWGNRLDADLAVSNPGNRPDNSARPPSNATHAGSAPVESVRRAIQGDAELRDSVHRVDVVAQNNRLVLRGTVPSEDVKEKVEDRAEEAAYGWRVDNQLRVEQR